MASDRNINLYLEYETCNIMLTPRLPQKYCTKMSYHSETNLRANVNYSDL